MSEKKEFQTIGKVVSVLRYVLPVLLLAVAFFAGWLTSRWQTRPFPGPLFADFQRLASRLELSQEQKAQLEPMIEKQRDEMLEIRRECRERVMSGRDNVKEQLESILTPEQMDKFKIAGKDFRQQHKPGRQRWRE